MKIENFISFWNQHNSAIIEILLALIILLTLVLAFRSFFAGNRKGSLSADGESLGVSPDLEFKLEKIIEAQKQQTDLVNKVAESVNNKHSFLDDSEGDVDDFEIQEGANKKIAYSPEVKKQSSSESLIKEKENRVKESEAEIAQLRITLAETQQKMLDMRKELEEVNSSTNAAGGSDGDASLLDKIAELEERLEEYSIISQDLADIPRLQEENAKLKSQIDQLLQQSFSQETSPSANKDEPIDSEVEISEEEYEEKAKDGVINPDDLEKLNVEDHAAALEDQISAALAMAELEQAADESMGASVSTDELESLTVNGGNDGEGASEFLVTDEMMDELQNALLEKQEGSSAPQKTAATENVDDFPADLITDEEAKLFSSFKKNVGKNS